MLLLELQVIVPVGLDPDPATVAVKVIGELVDTGLGKQVTVVVVDVWLGAKIAHMVMGDPINIVVSAKDVMS